MVKSEDQNLERVRVIVAEELDIPLGEVVPELGLLGHPKWDSITHVLILLRLESDCGLILNERVAEEVKTVGQMADRIRGN